MLAKIKRLFVVEFSRRVREGEAPYYEPMMKWQDSIERNIQTNRTVFWILMGAIVASIGINLVSLLMR